MATTANKAKRAETSSAKKPSIARTDVVDKTTRQRFEDELDAALKRKPTSEVKLAGALRAVASISPQLRSSLVEAAQVLVRRSSFTREIYGATIRTLAEADDKNTAALLKSALASEEGGGTATLSAAAFSRDPSLAGPLAKLAGGQKGQVAFAAETARVCRRESNGAHLAGIAPMIKEAHRISLCTELFVPIARGGAVPVHIGPALAVLRGAERHLGRWLVLADVATKAGDTSPLEEANEKATSGPSSARSAWSLVAWALADTRTAIGAPPPAAPTTRPTVELVARLSDRPSADRDTTFLFRMAKARAASCKPMLEASSKLVPGVSLTDEVSVRAASYLARDTTFPRRADMKDALLECAKNAKRDELRGFAVAALWDSGGAEERKVAREMADELVSSRCLQSVAWGALVRAAHVLHADNTDFVVASETPLRWIQWGWLE